MRKLPSSPSSSLSPSSSRPAASARPADRWPPLLLLLLAPLLLGWSFFDPFHESVEKGNESAAAGDAEQAESRYEEADRIDPGSPIPDFNRGVLRAREDGDPETARDAYLGAAASDDPAIASSAHYNLGNLQMRNEEYEAAVDSYLKSLDLGPEDMDTRRNLELALERWEEQQQQQQQQEQEQQEDGEPNDEEQQDQQQKDQEDQEEEEQQQPEQQEQPQEDQQEEPPEPQPEEQFSREDAERLLNAVQTDELKVLEQLRDEQESPGVSAHDW